MFARSSDHQSYSRIARRLGACLWLLLAATVGGSCGHSHETHYVDVALRTEAVEQATVTDLGYAVTFTEARFAIRDLLFTQNGEAHMAVLQRLSNWLVPEAHAHPGHNHGGDITGEAQGRWVVSFLDSGTSFAIGTLAEGDYDAADVRYTVADEELVDAADPLFGASVLLAGSATRDEETVSFTVRLTYDDGALVAGVAFDATVRLGSNVWLSFLPYDPLSDAHLMDGVDFLALAEGDTVALDGTGEAGSALRARLLTHDHLLFEERFVGLD